MLSNHSSTPEASSLAGYTLGVLGGLGPLASNEFLRTVYECHLSKREQLLPRVVLYSDPTFPDRTETLLSGSHGELLDRLIEALRKLCGLGVSNIVICCITIHYLFPELPIDLREKIISLVDLILAETIRKRQKQLLLCTYGSRKLGLFQSNSRWACAEEFIVLPDETDQQSIHAMIYRLKNGDSIEAQLPVLDALISKYEVDSFIAGCTEMHLLSKRMVASAEPHRHNCIDPLISIAKSLGDEAASPALLAEAALHVTPHVLACG